MQNKGSMQTQLSHEELMPANHAMTPNFPHAERRTTPVAWIQNAWAMQADIDE
jgi:hypothetical protein